MKRANAKLGCLIVISSALACERTQPPSRSDQVAASATAASPTTAARPASTVTAAPPAATPALEPTPRPSAAPAVSGPEFTAGIVEYKPKPSHVAMLTDVRSAKHEGFDRTVFEFAKGPLPGYHLEYIDKPVRKCGSGEATPIEGDAWLEVRFEPADAHTPSGAPTIKQCQQKPALTVVKELELTCDFEAHVTWVLGVSSPSKYRVLTLDDPLRLVVDVKH